MDKIIILGSGGHAKSIVDTLEQTGQYEIAGFLEIPSNAKLGYKNYRVIGTDDEMQSLYENQGIHYAFVGIGYLGKPTVREMLFGKLKEFGYQLPVIIDRTASIALDVHIDEGTYIGKHAIVDVGADIGKMCIINAGAIIGHDCRIEEYTHVAVGAVLSGEVQVGKSTFIGANATVIQELHVGQQVIIGAGSVVLHDVPDYSRMAGNPSRMI